MGKKYSVLFFLTHVVYLQAVNAGDRVEWRFRMQEEVIYEADNLMPGEFSTLRGTYRVN